MLGDLDLVIVHDLLTLLDVSRGDCERPAQSHKQRIDEAELQLRFVVVWQADLVQLLVESFNELFIWLRRARSSRGTSL